MTRKSTFVFPLILFCLFVFSQGAHAATVNAASCSNANVQSAINSASSGDTVVVPAGSCTWTSTVNISGKGITLQGAGIDKTTITDQASGGEALNINGASATNFITVTGFTFIKSTNHSDGIIQIDGSLFSVGFRVHHIRIASATSGSRGIGVTSVYGLIDHVTFDVTAGSGSIQSIQILGSSVGSDGGFTPWMQPQTLGSNKAVYIEDNTFNYGSTDEDSIDAYSGARFVIRYNKFNNAHVGFHGTDSGGNRGPFSFEVYNNTFTNNSSTTFRGGTIRGGSGVWFNNTYGGSRGTWYSITQMLYRACPALIGGGWGTCDGTQYKLSSADFKSDGSRSTSTSGSVKFCSIKRDTVCTSDSTCASVNGGTCSTFFDGSGTSGYACRDQPGRTHDQALSPIYAWNNGNVHLGTYDGGGSCGPGLDNYVKSGRDYIDGSAMPGYTAYAYPHPLQGGGGAPDPTPDAPEPPVGLSVIVN